MTNVLVYCIFVQNKSRKVFNNAVQDKSLKVRQYMSSRSSLRQVKTAGNAKLLCLSFVDGF